MQLHFVRVCRSLVFTRLAPTIMFVAAATTALAVPALPGIRRLAQPDGTTFQARLWGDERLHGWETAAGYTILRDEATGYWYYVEPGPSGDLERTSARAGLDPVPNGAAHGLGPKPSPFSRGRAGRIAPADLAAAVQAVPTSGIGSVPVLLVQFSDVAGAKTPASFDTLLFGSGNSSLADYYREVSYDRFTVSAGPSGIGGWYTAGHPHDYYGANYGGVDGADMWPGDLVWEAANAANNAGFDFAPYDQDGDCWVDNLVVVHQGTGEEVGEADTDIWSHSWNLDSAALFGYSHYGPLTTNSDCPTQPARKIRVSKYTMQPEILLGTTQVTIGVFAHELGHALGLPDLYDTDFSSEGVGIWSLMASGSWNREANAGDRPAHVDAWGKWKLGWISPAAVTCATSVALPAVESSPGGVFRLRDGSAPQASGEYFLLENRQRSGFDVGLPGSGLLVWRVNEARPNNNGECWPGPATPPPLCSRNVHYKVTLLQADNSWSLEKHDNRGDAGDPYPGTSDNTALTGSSTPNSNVFAQTSGTGGLASGVSVTAISPSAAIMTARLEAGGECQPFITGFTPTSGPVGTPLAITGGRFTGATAVRFNGAPATYRVESATSISATVPDGATTGPISVTIPTGTGASGYPFTVTTPCTDTYSIHPGSASHSRGAGAGSVAVTAGGGCPWTATSSDPAWLAVTAGASGSGEGSVEYSIAANGGVARTAILSIAGWAFRVTQAGSFTNIGADLAEVFAESVEWGDYDNDGDLDLLLTGQGNVGFPAWPVAKVFRNEGEGIFTDTGAELAGVWDGSAVWGDHDNDGDLDILLAGDSAAGPVAKVYRNSEDGFHDIGANLTGVRSGSVAWGDYDNDGNLDILITGTDAGGDGVAKVFRNWGGGIFTDIRAGLTGVVDGSVAWGDYDNDGDPDILLAGQSSLGLVARVYRNDGYYFTDIEAELPGVFSVAWGDYDNDGDLDILLAGSVTKVYRNDGNGFRDTEAGLPSIGSASVAWGDYDNDGDLDILLAGESTSGRVALVFRNDGGGVFTDVGAGLPGAAYGATAWGDFDNDGDLDLLLTGIGADGRIATVYRNDGATANATPDPPGALAAAVYPQRVTLSWNAASDPQTPATGLTYNLRVGTSSGASDVVSPMADGTTGYRHVVRLGNVQHGTTAWLKSLPAGTYYWSAQAVDTAFAGSPFAAESTFVKTCGGAIDPSSASVPTAGGSGTVRLTGMGGCAWIARSDVPWITVTSGASGTGDGVVGYSVEANTGPTRVGTLAIAGETLTVTQSPACSYAIAPTIATATAAGGPGTVEVTTASWCPWTAVSHAPAWLSITNMASGMGNGTVDYLAAPTSGGVRGGTLTIAGLAFAVTQVGVAAQELTHGSRALRSLAATPGPSAHVDRFLVGQAPYSSYEVIVDDASTDAQQLLLERWSGDEATLLQSSTAVGVGGALSLRWHNSSATRVTDELVLVTSGVCTTGCGTDAVYRIRLYETACSIPRFNNSGSQVTVLLLQNPGAVTVSGSIYFWGSSGALIASHAVSIGAKQLFTLRLPSLPALTGQSGSITVAHDGGYGSLVGKAVALDPWTGVTIDSPMIWRPVR